MIHNALEEAQRVVSELACQVKQAERLKFDKEFIGCLAEEIELAKLDSSMQATEALFEVHDDGSVNFVAISDGRIKSATHVSIPLVSEKDSMKFIATHIGEQVDIFSLLTQIRETYNKERSKIFENLDQISQSFDKALIETILQHKKDNSTAAKEAKEYLELDIATKRQKLLQKLLGEKTQ